MKMNKITLSSVFFFASIIFSALSLYSQERDTIYLNKEFRETDPQQAETYRVIYKKSDKEINIKEYYKGGQIKSEGGYLDKKYTDKTLEKKHGLFINYYENGQMDNQGKYLKNKMEGEWKWYFKNGQVSAEESYRKGKLTFARYFDEEGNRVSPEVAVKPPGPPGGMAYFLEYLQSQMNYPLKAVEQGIEGTVIIRVLINEQGELESTSILKSVDPLLDLEALRLTKSIPAKFPKVKEHNRIVKYWMDLPYKFSLNRQTNSVF